MSLKKNNTQNDHRAYIISGQTIVEVLVALALITLFLSGIAIVELYAVRNAQYAQKKSMATSLARQQLERARVVRDSAGISELYPEKCSLACYINSQLTPIPLIVTPTGTYSQWLIIQEDNEACPLPAITITPFPQSYKATATVSWAVGAAVTPPPQVSISSCITDWR